MKGRTFFKTIVLFGKSFPQETYLRESFVQYDFIKVFRTTTSDELEQILNQSEQTAIFSNDFYNIAALTGLNVSKMKISGVRNFFIDTDGRLTKKEIEELSHKKISVLVKPKNEEIKKKLDMYFMSKVQLARYKVDEITAEFTEPEYKKSYFTHFRETDYGWMMIASTHEQEQEIEVLFKRSWTTFYQELLERASQLKAMEVDQNFSDLYVSVIFPHFKGKERALSVLHLKKDEANYQEQYDKALKFLEQL